MKQTKNAITCLMGVVLMTMVAASTAAPALNGQLGLRPLTSQEIKDYSLTGVQSASGLSTVAIGQPAYFDALVNRAIAGSDIVSVTWVLTNTPAFSTAVLTASPLGANVPTYKMADRLTLQVAGRTMLRPDIVGQYTVRATIVTTGSGTTNVTLTITAGTYLGINTCALCHSGGIVASNIVTPWLGTPHSGAFTRAINGESTDHFTKNCISCHSVGFDANTNSANGGFDDVAARLGWTFPAVLAPTNWAYMQAVYPSLANVANIQCENCHGPGSQHAYSLGNTNMISKTFGAGNCAQCHDSLTHHVKTAEWNGSRHAVATRTPSGPNRYNCVRCHTAGGFEDYISHAGSTNTYATNTVYEAITCAACHDPHDASNPHQLRAANVYTLPEGTTVTNVGLGALCMTCHHSRNGEANTNIANYQQGKPTWAGGSSFGVHDSTAGDMIEGVNGITYGKVIPSGSHSASITNVCVGCHMQPVATTDPAFGKAGGHTFSMTYPMVSGGVTNIVDKVDVCVQCHGPITTFDMVRKDYNSDGVIEGIQTEVQKLLNKLSTLLPNSTYQANSNNYVADGLVKTSVSTKTNWPTKFLQGAWNWQFVNVEGSMGVHNAPYAVGVLKASIADLTGDANFDGLPDWWQIQYFGSTTNSNASPYAAPAGDGVPNWLKYSSGLNPFVPGVPMTGGYVFGPSLVNPLGTNAVTIYTAAEISFNTQVGTTYQIQSIGNMGDAWQNVGGSIAGTGGSINYVTQTRTPKQQFFRVVHTP